MSPRKTAEQTRFQSALSHVLSVSKAELLKREEEYKAERSGKPKPGPKSKKLA